MNAQGRVPPQDIEIEKALLGSLLLNTSAMFEVSDIVNRDSFYSPKHAIIYDAMMGLHSKGEPIDVVTVAGKLKERKQLTDIGGATYLNDLVGSSASPGSAQHYANIVQSKYTLRCLINASQHVHELGFDETQDIEQTLDKAQQLMFAVSQSPSLRTFKAMKDELKEAWERLEKLQGTGDGMRGVPSGFKDLDTLLSGFQKSDLVILAARPAHGKTALALDIARNSAIKHGTSVGIFSLEMSSQQLVDRMLSAQAGVDAWKLRTGRIAKNDEETYGRLQEAMAALSEAPIYIDDKPGTTVLTMRSVARRLKVEKNLGLLIVDYLQLITPANTKTDNVVSQVTEISRGLKGLARELEVPVIALSQLSRAVEQRRGTPRLSDLRDSGSIEQDADVVMFIHRDDKMNDNSDRPGIAEIMVEKHRNGPVGKVELRFDGNKTTFVDIDKSDFGDFGGGDTELAPF